MGRSLALALALALSGCAVQPMYSWGGYDSALYSTYKDPTKSEEMRGRLEALIAESEQRNQKVPPGIYAELGTMYLQAGSGDKAIAMYTKERDAWPESRGMMTALIQTLERRQAKPESEAAK